MHNSPFAFGLKTFQADTLRLAAGNDPSQIELGDALHQAFVDSGFPAVVRDLSGPITSNAKFR